MRKLLLISLGVIVALAVVAFLVIDPLDDGAPSGDVVSLWPEVPPAHVGVVNDEGHGENVPDGDAGVQSSRTSRSDPPSLLVLRSPRSGRLEG